MASLIAKSVFDYIQGDLYAWCLFSAQSLCGYTQIMALTSALTSRCDYS